MTTLPNLAKVATSDLVEQIGGSGFKASYINWSRTMQLLRDNAPGWMPELVTAPDNTPLHRDPVGAHLSIRFRHVDGTLTPEVPQAVMDNSNKAVPYEKITARDVTDTHVRGVCKAAAFTFGLAYELWAKLPLESGYHDDAPAALQDVHPAAGVWESIPKDDHKRMHEIAAILREYAEAEDYKGAWEYIERQDLATEEKAAVWSDLPAPVRSALKASKQAMDKVTGESS